MIITFIYKIKGSDTKYYGKYIGYITDDYEEGLDVELFHELNKNKILERYYSVSCQEDITIGILGFSRGESYDFFSEKESNIFDLLYCDWHNNPEIYVNGKKIKDV